MDYNEFRRNIGKAGLTIKEFAGLLKVKPNSITNLKTKGNVSKNLGIIAVLLGELADNQVPFKNLFEKLDLQEQKARRDSNDNTLFKPKKKE